MHRLPLLGLHRLVTGVEDGVDHITVIKVFGGRAACFQGAEHVGEHVNIAQFRQFIAHREEPAGGPFGLFRHVAALAHGGEHFKAGAQEVVGPDRAFGARDFVAQIHAAAEGPRHLELPDGAVGIFD